MKIYAISDGARVKVGFSRNPTARAAYLQSVLKRRMTLMHEAAASEARLVERFAHQLLASKRLDGEWFDVSPDEAISAIRQAIDHVAAGVRPKYEDDRIDIRVPPALKAAAEAAAERAGMTLSAWIKKLILENLPKEAKR